MNKNSDADSPPPDSAFDEEWYLRRYTDVAAAVRSGGFRSGWQHYRACGQAEGRAPGPSGQFRTGGLAGPMPDNMIAARLAIQLLLGYDEWNEDIIREYANFRDVHDLKRRLCESLDYHSAIRLVKLARLMYSDEDIVRRATLEFEQFLSQPPDVEQKIQTLVMAAAKVDRYAAYHWRRFRDQIRAVAALREKRLSHKLRPRVLDIGQAPVTAMYAQVVPNIDLYTVNQQFGTSVEEVMAKYGSLQHYFIDLEKEAINQKYSELRDKPFDIIIFCEVIEHVRASPTEQIADLLKILSPEGVLILSTPNALALRQLRSLARGRKGDSIYSRVQHHLHDDHHIHVREFTFNELADAVHEAGGKVVMYGIKNYYSEDDPTPMELDYISGGELQTMIISHTG